MNKPELINDYRFHDLESRARNQDILKGIIENKRMKNYKVILLTSNEQLLLTGT